MDQTDNDSTELAFDEGYDAARNGLSETANQYEPDDDRHLSWNDGFAAAVDYGAEEDVGGGDDDDDEDDD